MSYQVLARKWRPKNFEELQGQEHASRALINAIETGRLHHAYLFTGTRGVGKTTIARILSKCLNCETSGITSKPCGECASCCEIDQGRFVDLIEVDAASRTKVDDTRELLENVQYRPTRGRYKVYLIDEVHMLSNSSFNALLKTLEEPPEHVIFLLATTDPQKLPVTVLSRCLQFHLKHMDEQTIAKHLAFIMHQEQISFEETALNLIAQSAEGSMRDALSLLDQAIAFGQGQVQEQDIRVMLGTIDHQFMVKLLEALANKDSAAAINVVNEMSNYPVDFADALKELLARLHQIAIYQATQVILDSAASYVAEFAEHISSQDIQLYYQMGLHARRDLEWAPTPKQGLEMALLRMLAFQIDESHVTSSSSANSGAKKKVSVEFSRQYKAEPAQAKSFSYRADETAQTDSKPLTIQGESQLSAKADDLNQAKVEQGASLDEKAQPAVEQFFSDEPPFNPDDYQQFQAEEELEFNVVDNVSEQKPTEDVIPTVSNRDSTQEIADKALASLHSALGLSLQDDSTQPVTHSVQDRPLEASSRLTSDTKNDADSGLADHSVEPHQPEDSKAKQSQSLSDDIPVSTESRELSSSVDNINQEPLDSHPSDQEDAYNLVPSSESKQWAELVKALDLTGTYHQILQSSTVLWDSDHELTIKVSPDQNFICTESAKKEIALEIEQHFARKIRLQWSFAEPEMETPAMIWEREAKERHRKACNMLNQHPFAMQLQQAFLAQLDEKSIQYLEHIN